MALILNIETSTAVCSVCLAKDGEKISIEENNEANNHSANLLSYIEKVLDKSGFKASDIDAIAVSQGPGSYTGLRIGVSAAKGLCYGLGKPLIAIPTLKSMAAGAIAMLSDSKDWFFCPMIDARRMEVYAAVFNSNLEMLNPVEAVIVDENSFKELLEKQPVLFFGDGAMKCKELLEKSSNALFNSELAASAAYMTKLSEEAFNNGKLEDVAYLEPFYLKDYIAGISKNKVLG
ncbi:MAG: tRNA (adenosine(37)-N6)-threonylcarbamoyltransferase complex dimerization subunit type 1 TsaB [Bacteroidota bacterium]